MQYAIVFRRERESESDSNCTLATAVARCTWHDTIDTNLSLIRVSAATVGRQLENM